MSRYPDLPGFQNETTSRQGALDFAPKAETIRNMVLESIRGGGIDGAIPPEVAKKLNLPVPSVQPRFSELNREGLIFDSGRTRPGLYKKDQIVWVTKEHYFPEV